MPIATRQHIQRQHARIGFEVGGDLMVVVRRNSTSDDNEEFAASPLDVSLNGMKLSMSQALVFGEVVKLHFQSNNLDIDFDLDAEVRWIRQGENDDVWLVGCAFATQLNDERINSLATAGGVDRRRSPRIKLEMQATVQLACNTTPFRVTLLDYSATGLRFASDATIEPNEPIKVRLTNDVGREFEVMATCRWRSAYESGDLVGCEIIGNHRGEFDLWRQSLSKGEPQPSRVRWRLDICWPFIALGDYFSSRFGRR
jgi:c-di-GMP-binding flagellar brake protein YcgR